MKIHILLLMLITCLFVSAPLFAGSPDTNTSISIDNVGSKVNDGKLLISEWDKEISQIKANGFSIASLLSIISLVFTSIIVLGVIIVMLLKVIQFFTDDAGDAKIKVIEDWVTNNLIKIPITLLDKIRGFLKKKS